MAKSEAGENPALCLSNREYQRKRLAMSVKSSECPLDGKRPGRLRTPAGKRKVTEASALGRHLK